MPEGERPALGATMPCTGFRLVDMSSQVSSKTVPFSLNKQHDMDPSAWQTTILVFFLPFTTSLAPCVTHACAAGEEFNCLGVHCVLPPPLGTASAE